VAALLLVNITTFSSTGTLCILFTLMSFVGIRGFMVFSSVCAAGLCTLFVVNQKTFLILFHLSSVNARWGFVQEMLRAISWAPHLGGRAQANFTPDAYVLWYAFLYGKGYLILLGGVFIAFLLGIRNKKMLGIAAIFFVLNVVSLFSNGIFMTTPNNILLPVITGILFANSSAKRKNGVPIGVSWR